MLKYIFILILLAGCCDTGIQAVEAISFRWLDGNVQRFGISEKKILHSGNAPLSKSLPV